MDAVNFPQATKNMGAPPGFTKEEIFDLPVNEGFYFIRGYNPVACLTSCWELSYEDWAKWKPEKMSEEAWSLLKPKEPRIYLSIMGYGMPAVSVFVGNPFSEQFDPEIGKYYHKHGKFPEDFQQKLEEEKKQANDSYSK